MPEGVIDAPAPAAFKTFVPTEFHDREYLKPWLDKPWSPELGAEVIKKLDGAQSLLGKKSGIPASDAKPEEWDAFYGKLRSEKPEDYEVGIGDPKDEKLLASLRSAFHGAGIHKGQAAKFQALLKPFFDEQDKARTDADTKLASEFDTIAQQTFGEKDKQDAAIASARETVKAYVPANLLPLIDKLDNGSLAVLIASVNAIKTKYAPGEAGNPNNNGNTAGDVENLRAEGRKLLSSKEYKDVTHPDHEKTAAKVKELYDRIAKAGGAA
jgi:hypothetical protein